MGCLYLSSKEAESILKVLIRDETNKSLIKRLEEIVVSDIKYEHYHKSFADAIVSAYNYANELGYEVIDENVFVSYNMHIPLRKAGKDVKEYLHIIITEIREGRFELVTYIN